MKRPRDAEESIGVITERIAGTKRLLVSIGTEVSVQLMGPNPERGNTVV